MIFKRAATHFFILSKEVKESGKKKKIWSYSMVSEKSQGHFIVRQLVAGNLTLFFEPAAIKLHAGRTTLNHLLIVPNFDSLFFHFPTFFRNKYKFAMLQ